MKVLAGLELFGGIMDYNKREDVPKEYKWDLTKRYLTDEAWEKDYKKAKRSLKNITKYEKEVISSPESLFNTLEEYFKIDTLLTKIYLYASLKHDEDLGNNEYSLMLNKAYALYNAFVSLSSYLKPAILSLSKTKLDKYLKDKNLKKYAFYLEEINRSKEHTLNASEEKLISKLTVNDNVFENVNNILIDSTLNYGTIMVEGKEVTITNSNYRSIMTNKDRNIRIKCYNLLAAKMKEFSNIFAENLVANMKSYSTIAEVRNFKSTMDMQLFSSNIPNIVVSNLYKVIHKRLDIFQKYLLFLKKNLGLEKLAYYDMNTEFLNNDLTFSIEDAQMLISEATKIYGDEYHQIIEKAFDEQWIDYGSYKGKRSGAYCTCNYGNNPVILTNFHGKFEDVSAIAHELGHAVNFYLSGKNNSAHEANNDIFVAEVASLTNEIVLSTYIMQNSKQKDLKLVAIYNLIDIIQNNLFDAGLEGELENKLYGLIDKKEEVNADLLSKTIYDLRKEYYGNAIELDDNVKYMWARRVHYFFPFYLFKYATGVSAAIYVATKIINNEDNMKEKYLKFLSRGETDYPINLLKDLGVDMTKEDVVNKAIDFFNYLIDEFNKVSEE